MREEKDKYSGMTLNEMLFNAGLIGDFDNAVKKRDKIALVQILQKVNISNENAEQIITTIFDNPRRYGFA